MNKSDFYKNIGKNIKKYRLEYSKHTPMTQEILAEYANVSVSLISKLESDKEDIGISIEVLYRISVILEKNISCFLEVTDDE